MKYLLFTLLSIIIVLNACKENPVEQSYGTISAYVYDKATDKPIEGAFIKTNPATTTILSDQNGKLTIKNLSGKYYTITSEKSGYQTSIIEVEVKDGKETSCIIPMVKFGDTLTSGLNAPFNPNPINNSVIKTQNPTLSWSCYNPNNSVLTYSIYFGTNPANLNQIATGLTTTSYNQSNLQQNVNYYWKVKVTDSKGNTLSSDIWSFTINADINTTLPTDYYVYLPFDGNINDYSNNHWPTSSANNEYIADHKGNANKAIKLGNNGNVLIDDVNVTNYGNSDISVSVWLKPNMSCHVPSYGTHIGLVSDFSSKGYFGITYLNELECWTTGYNWVGCKRPMTDNVWSHVAFVFKRDIGVCKIYVNGNLEASGSLPDFQNNLLSKMQIGGRNQLGDQYCGGMDDLKIFKRALTEQEIINLVSN